MGLKKDTDKKRYLTILADGKLHERVDEDTEGAKVRTKKEQDGTVVDVEDKDGNTIYELTYPGIVATIKDVKFNESDYGTNVNIELEDEDDNQFILSLACSSNYGERFMEVLPNLDLNEEVDFTPYSFTPKGKSEKVRGLTIMQDGEKVENAFATKDGDEWEVLIKGFPMPDPKKKYNSEKWKTFFAQRREWLMDYLTEAGLIKAADASDDAEEEEAEEEAPKKKAVAKKEKKSSDDDDF
jgi:hypothetical protein